MGLGEGFGVGLGGGSGGDGDGSGGGGGLSAISGFSTLAALRTASSSWVLMRVLPALLPPLTLA